jgi:hypothetical protein
MTLDTLGRPMTSGETPRLCREEERFPDVKRQTSTG